ncbi:MAG: cytochrome c [Woeseiaceae bacterium]|nr:cytochrome c [Woeseiaceae bacterium]
MNNRQARHFAIASTAIAAFIFLALTVDSHRQFPELTNAEDITPAVTRGKDVWHDNNCINCHTLFGEGAYYAPDLTKISELRGEPYLRAYMRDPSQFYDEQKHRRLMPKQDLSEDDIGNLIAFFDWVAKVDNQGWPPRPIYVTGQLLREGAEAEPALAAGAVRPVTESSDPRALGENLYSTVSPACNACHSTRAGADMAGPSLAGLGDSRGKHHQCARVRRGSNRRARLYPGIDSQPQRASRAGCDVLGERRLIHAEHLQRDVDRPADRSYCRVPGIVPVTALCRTGCQVPGYVT